MYAICNNLLLGDDIMDNKSTNINIRVNKELKKQADELFKSLGTNTSSAINIFLTQCVREQSLTFIPSMIAPEPSDNLKEALKEAEAIEKGEIKSKGYHNMDEMFMAICDDEEDYE